MARITAEDFTAILARVQAELTRRNGNGDLSGYASTTVFPVNDPVSTGNLVKTSAVNTLLTGLGRINPAGLPVSVSAGDYINESTLDGISTKLSVFEKQPRGATSGNDCASLCSGMCVSQCTTTCSTTCTGGCQDSCSTTCTGGCESACANNCTGGCKTSCSGSCSGSCTGGCDTGCGGCTACTGCRNGCYHGCSTTCGSNCGYTCSPTCGSSCKGECTGNCKGSSFSNE